MYLNEIRVEASPWGTVDPKIGWQTHYLRQGFVACLSPKFELDGSSLVNIFCGPRGRDSQWRQVLGITAYYVEDFDVAGWAGLTMHEREESILYLVEEVLSTIAKAAGNDVSRIRAAGAALRAADFRSTTEIAKLSKALPGTRYRVHVFRTLSREHQEAWQLRVLSRDGQVIEEVALRHGPIDHRDIYKRAVVEGGEYVLFDRLNRVTFRHRVADGRDPDA